VRAFEAFGGVPIGMIGYDNLKPAVAKTWFAGLLRDGFSLTVDETNLSFASLGAASSDVIGHVAEPRHRRRRGAHKPASGGKTPR
jgi:hypothetical protein